MQVGVIIIIIIISYLSKVQLITIDKYEPNKIQNKKKTDQNVCYLLFVAIVVNFLIFKISQFREDDTLLWIILLCLEGWVDCDGHSSFRGHGRNVRVGLRPGTPSRLTWQRISGGELTWRRHDNHFSNIVDFGGPRSGFVSRRRRIVIGC